jgi:hypothetical protein
MGARVRWRQQLRLLELRQSRIAVANASLQRKLTKVMRTP